MIAAYQASKERLPRHVKTQLDHIHDIFHDLPIRRVTKRGFLTNALAKLTGLATQDQLYSLTDFLQKIEQGLVTVSDAWKTGTQHFMAAFRADKARVDNIFRVLHLQRQSIFQLQSQLTRFYHRSSARVEFFY